jgi:hypothetical protein
MTDEERAKKVVRDVFLYDLKGEIGTLARLGVPLADRQDIIRRLAREFSLARKDEESKSAV